MEQSKLQMSPLHIGILYLGSLMGAGFASGKESWQFFSVFGIQGLLGIALSILIFMGYGYMVITIAYKMQTSDMSKLIFPADNPKFEAAVGIAMQVFLFMAYFSMLAAGGVLLEEQFGLYHAIGSLVMMVLVTITTISGFETVSKRIQKIVPFLLAGTLILSAAIMMKSEFHVQWHVEAKASPLASNWILASITLVSYNLTGGIPILGKCGLCAGDLKRGQLGGMMGGLLLGGCSLLLYFTTLTDPGLAAESALPMLSLCGKLAPWVEKIYALMLMIAIFGTATSTLYGVSTKLPAKKHHTLAVCVMAALGFMMSLFGFSNLVAFMYPLAGYGGLIFLICLAVNFVRIKTGKRVKSDEYNNA